MRVLEITQEVNREELQEAVKKETHPKRRTWLEILLFVLAGWQGKAVSKWLNVHPVTVSRVVQRFNADGWDGLNCRCPGRQSGIPVEAETEIVNRLEQALYADPQHQEIVRGRDIQKILADQYGMVVHKTTVYRLLHRLRYTVLHPRPRHPKKDDGQSEIFKKEDLAGSHRSGTQAASWERSDPLFSR